MEKDIEWFLFRGKDSKGPFSSQQLKRLYDEGKLSPSMTVWRKGMTQKLPITAIREFDFRDQMQASQPVVVEAMENKTFPIATTRKPKGVFVRPEKLNQTSVFTHPAFIACASAGFVALLLTSGVLGTSSSGNQTVAAIAPLPMADPPQAVADLPQVKDDPPKVASLDDERTSWGAEIDELTNERKGILAIQTTSESSNKGGFGVIDFGGQNVHVFMNHIGFNIWMPDDFRNGQKKSIAFRTPKMNSPKRVSADIDNSILRFEISRKEAVEILKAGRIVMSVVDDNKRYTFEYRDQDVQKAIKYISR